MARRRDFGGALAGLGQQLTQFGQLRASRQEDEERLQQQQQTQAQQRQQDQLLKIAGLVQGGTDPQAAQSLAQSLGVDSSGLDLSQFAPSDPTTQDKLQPVMDFITKNPEMATPEVIDFMARQMGVDQGEGARAGLTPLPGVPPPEGAGQVQQLQQFGGALRGAVPQDPITVGSNQRVFDPASRQVILDAIKERQRPIQASPGSQILDPDDPTKVLKTIPFAPRQAPQPRAPQLKAVTGPDGKSYLASVNLQTNQSTLVTGPDGQPVEVPQGFDPMEFLLGGGPQGGGQGGAPPAVGAAPGQNPFRK